MWDRPLISVVSTEGSEVALNILELESSTCQMIHISNLSKGAIHRCMHTSSYNIHVCALIIIGSTPDVTGHAFLSNGRYSYINMKYISLALIISDSVL